METRTLNAQRRFREGYELTMEDDLADALKVSPFDLDDGPEMIAPDMEAMPGT